MRRVFLGLAAGLLILVVGFAIARFFRRTSEVALEQPPCSNCSGVYALSSAIPTVKFCDLAANSYRYANQLVRLRAVFTNDAAQTTLSALEGECPEKNLGMLTGLDESCKGCTGARKALTVYSGFETWYDSRARVVVVGRVERINNPKSYYNGKSGFNILCLEHVEPIGSGEWERKNYERGWLF